MYTALENIAQLPHAVAHSTATPHVQAHGRAMGLRLQAMPQPPTDLSHAMEELSALFEERAVKRLAERQISVDALRAPRGYEAVIHALRLFPDLPSAETFAQMIAWLNAHSDASPQDVLAYLSETCRNAALQWVALQALARSDLRQNASQHARLVAAERFLLDTQDATLRAEFNLAPLVNETALSRDALPMWRTLYTSEVLGFTTPQACFRNLCAQYAPEHLAEAIAFLIKGCGLELHDVHPSQHPEALRRILLDLQCVEVLRTILECLTQLLTRLHTHYGERATLSSAGLMEKVVALTENAAASEREMEAVEKACGWRHLQTRIDFGHAWVAVLRSLSARLFQTETQQRQLVEAAEAWLENVIILEEDARA